MMIPIVKAFSAPSVNQREILRYMGGGEAEGAVAQLLDGCLAELLPSLSYKVSYTILDVSAKEEETDVGVFTVKSRDLARALRGCRRVVLFCATVGLALDTLIRRYSVGEPARAACVQAIGTERVEALCDVFEAEIRAAYGATRPRVSPGYGDIPLEEQKRILPLLDCSRKLGVSLSKELLMMPSKSVTAFIGII